MSRKFFMWDSCIVPVDSIKHIGIYSGLDKKPVEYHLRYYAIDGSTLLLQIFHTEESAYAALHTIYKELGGGSHEK